MFRLGICPTGMRAISLRDAVSTAETEFEPHSRRRRICRRRERQPIRVIAHVRSLRARQLYFVHSLRPTVVKIPDPSRNRRSRQPSPVSSVAGARMTILRARASARATSSFASYQDFVLSVVVMERPAFTVHDITGSERPDFVVRCVVHQTIPIAAHVLRLNGTPHVDGFIQKLINCFVPCHALLLTCSCRPVRAVPKLRTM